MLQAVWQFLSSCKSPCDAFPPTLWLTEACNRASQLRAMSQWLLPLQTHSLQPSHSFELCKHHRKRLTLAKVKNPSDLTATCRNLQQLTTVRSMSPFEQMDDAQQMSSAPGCLDGLGRVGPVGPLGLKTFWNKGHGRDRGPHSLWQPQDQPPNPSKSNSLKVVYQCSPSFSLEKNGKKYVSIVSIPFWRISPDLERLGNVNAVNHWTQWTTESGSLRPHSACGIARAAALRRGTWWRRRGRWRSSDSVWLGREEISEWCRVLRVLPQHSKIPESVEQMEFEFQLSWWVVSSMPSVFECISSDLWCIFVLNGATAWSYK